jgi:hypothetical protein
VLSIHCGGLPLNQQPCVHQTIHETGCLPSVSVHSEREVVPDINTEENILEVGSETCTAVHSGLPII